MNLALLWIPWVKLICILFAWLIEGHKINFWIRKMNNFVHIKTGEAERREKKKMHFELKNVCKQNSSSLLSLSNLNWTIILNWTGTNRIEPVTLKLPSFLTFQSSWLLPATSSSPRFWPEAPCNSDKKIYFSRGRSNRTDEISVLRKAIIPYSS